MTIPSLHIPKALQSCPPCWLGSRAHRAALRDARRLLQPCHRQPKLHLARPGFVIWLEDSFQAMMSWSVESHLVTWDQLGVSWDHVFEIELKIEQIWNHQSILSNPSRGAMHFQNRRLQDPLFSLQVATVMGCFDLWRWMVCRFHDIWRPRGRLCSAPCEIPRLQSPWTWMKFTTAQHNL